MVLPDYRILERGLRWTPEKIDNYFRSGANSGWFTLDERAFEKGRKPNIAGIFANQLGTYYDMWALKNNFYYLCI